MHDRIYLYVTVITWFPNKYIQKERSFSFKSGIINQLET